MKNIIFILLLFCLHSMNAQFEQKSNFIDGFGSLNISHDKYPQNENKQLSTYSSFSYGISISENSFFFIGLGTEGYSSFRNYRQEFNGNVFTNESTSQSNIYSISSGIEKFLELNKKLYLVTSFSGTFGLGKSSFEQTDSSRGNFESSSTIFDFDLSIYPRLQYFINGKWAISSGIGSFYFSRQIRKDQNTSEKSKYTDFRSSFGLNTFGLGIRYYLNNTSE